MKATMYVVFGPDGHQKTLKTKPNRKQIPHRGGYFRFSYEIDDTFFERPPAPEVKVDIPVESVGEPEVDVQVVDPTEVNDGTNKG